MLRKRILRRINFACPTVCFPDRWPHTKCRLTFDTIFRKRLKSYYGEQNQGYHVKEHKKLCQKQVSKVTLHFVFGKLSRKQTVARVISARAGPQTLLSRLKCQKCTAEKRPLILAHVPSIIKKHK